MNQNGNILEIVNFYRDKTNRLSLYLTDEQAERVSEYIKKLNLPEKTPLFPGDTGMWLVKPVIKSYDKNKKMTQS